MKMFDPMEIGLKMYLSRPFTLCYEGEDDAAAKAAADK